MPRLLDVLDVLADWPESRAHEVMAARRVSALSTSSGITAASTILDPYFPFSSSDYPYQRLLGSMASDAWAAVGSELAAALVPIDPFTPSKHRNGLSVWDAAVGIPACTIRPERVVGTRELKTLRTTNTTWVNTIAPALSRVGRIGGSGEFLRPAGPFIVDLMYHPLGWQLLEGAHALAHRVGDTKHVWHKNRAVQPGRNNYHMQQFLFQLVVCMTYGMPMDMWGLADEDQGTPDIPQYGISLRSSGNLRAPVLQVPVVGDSAMCPDKTIAVISGGVNVEPHPFGFTNESHKWVESNRWSCSPTMVVIAGWELADVITHQAICANYPDSARSARDPLCYGMTPLDLQSPDTFWAYLHYAVAHNGAPRVDNQRYWFVEDWLASDDYMRAIYESPPLPCYECLRVNMRAEGAPSRPKSRQPEPREPAEQAKLKAGKLRMTTAELEWEEWDGKLKSMLSIVKDAVIFHEGRLYGHKEALRRRRKRLHGYKLRGEALRELKKLDDKIDRATRGGRPSDAARLTEEKKELTERINMGIMCTSNQNDGGDEADNTNDTNAENVQNGNSEEAGNQTPGAETKES